MDSDKGAGSFSSSFTSPTTASPTTVISDIPESARPCFGSGSIMWLSTIADGDVTGGTWTRRALRSKQARYNLPKKRKEPESMMKSTASRVSQGGCQRSKELLTENDDNSNHDPMGHPAALKITVFIVRMNEGRDRRVVPVRKREDHPR